MGRPTGALCCRPMPQRLGLIARADNGGLGNLLWEFSRHLHPDRVLVMDLGEYGRSDVHLERYAGLDTHVVEGLAPSADERAWLLDGCDVVYSAETWYADEEIPAEAAARGVRTVLHIMPELYPSRRADVLWNPTTYRSDLLPPHELVPVPVATDRFDRKVRGARHFVHQWAPAMKDRNGTLTLLAALELVTSPVTVTILGAQQHIELPASSPVDLRLVYEHPDNYWEVWPEDADVLVLPRRFAGLSMPVQEAAARGMTTIITAVSPQTGWPLTFIPHRGHENCLMAGGTVPVYDADPVSLASVIDRLANNPAEAEAASLKAAAWADDLSWERWAPLYNDALRGL